LGLAQPTLVTVNNLCPVNIGFEMGNFQNWQLQAGHVLRSGDLELTLTTEVSDRHSIYGNSNQPDVDYYGGFPVNCPNGSGYSVRLGNARGGGQAESFEYTFTIPADKNDYSFIYNYAVVFENPPHNPWEQPRFTSRIYNVTDNEYINCGSFEFIASGNLPGFQRSQFGKEVFFKPWAPVTVDLSGLAGKTVRLEFYTNDCAFTQHFGYAYIDVNENCSSSPISGNILCGIPKSVTLTAPFGFAQYSWYNEDFTKFLGSENILTINPVPATETKYAVVVFPFDGIGCEDTLYSTVKASPEPFELNVLPDVFGCAEGVDLTAPSITAGSTPGLNFSYFTNLNQTEFVPIPKKVAESGTYYIKGVNKVGCSEIKAINVLIKQPPLFVINNPAGVCVPQQIDITTPEVTQGSEQGFVLSYWMNPEATIPLSNANSISFAGTYYISAVKPEECSIVEPVVVKIGAIPNISINHPTGCGKVDITRADMISGTTSDLTYNYWTDPAATIALSQPNIITSSATYYISAASTSGCTIIKPAIVTVNPIPTFTVTDPLPVNYPVQTIDLIPSVNNNIGLNYTYWLDSLTRKPLNNPRAVTKRDRYFIRGTNEFGCSSIQPVNVVIIPPPEPLIYVPNAFTPNNDGLNDLFKIKIIGETTVNHLKIYSRWGQLVYDDSNLNKNWNGKLKGIDLPSGIYVWIIGGTDTYFKKPFTQKGMVTLIR